MKTERVQNCINMFKHWFVALPLAAILGAVILGLGSGCALRGRQAKAIDVSTRETSSASEGLEPQASLNEKDYRLARSDKIVVTVVGEKDFDQIEQRITSTGTITLPYLKEVEVKGKTTAELVAHLQMLLRKDYFTDPQVVVSVREYSKRTVTIIGQVMKQGIVMFPAEQGMNIMEAIGAAEGFTKLANTSRITITRRDKVISFNLRARQRNPEKVKLIELEPGDIVFIPESRL
ncbi:MAG: polysaccharide export protein [Verrucomicrobia bacterium]|nr:polysaccharide export protein [Verrucomicrobiota bacterium]